MLTDFAAQYTPPIQKQTSSFAGDIYTDIYTDWKCTWFSILCPPQAAKIPQITAETWHTVTLPYELCVKIRYLTSAYLESSSHSALQAN